MAAGFASLEERVPFFIVFGFYMAWMLAVAVMARLVSGSKDYKQLERSEFDTHFTANKTFGSIGLALTFYSTIYSGVTLSGVPNFAAAYGYASLMWLTSAVARPCDPLREIPLLSPARNSPGAGGISRKG